jgi:hypothetical protein
MALTILRVEASACSFMMARSPVLAEHLVGLVLGLPDAVGADEDDLPRNGGPGVFEVLVILHDSQGHAFPSKFVEAVAGRIVHDGRVMAGAHPPHQRPGPSISQSIGS